MHYLQSNPEISTVKASASLAAHQLELMSLLEAASQEAPGVAGVAAVRRALRAAIPALVQYADRCERWSRNSLSFRSGPAWSDVAGDVYSRIRELRTLESVAYRLIGEDPVEGTTPERYCAYVASCVEDWLREEIIAIAA